MKVVLLNEKRLSFLDLPSVVEGSFWITDFKDPDVKLINIESRKDQWYLVSNQDYWIIGQNKKITEEVLISNRFYIYGNDTERHIIYIQDDYDTSTTIYQISENTNISIGNDPNCSIYYNTPMIQSKYAHLSLKDGQWSIYGIEKAYIYLNNRRMEKPLLNLQNGDTIFIMGLAITVMGNLLIMNNPNNAIKLSIPNLALATFPKQGYQYEDVKEIDYYTEDDYFFKTPRLRRFISTYKLKIAPPPAKQSEEDMPFILLLGPMLTMAMTSTMSLLNVIIRLSNGSTTLANSWTTIVIGISMMAATLLWPTLTKRYRKKRMREKEANRREVYSKYLEEKGKLLAEELMTQSQILMENLLPLTECYDIIKNRKRILWERKITQKDFLTVRVGFGNVPLDADIDFNEDEFILEEDDMKEAAKKVLKQYQTIPSSPVGYSFFNEKVTAVMGIEDKVKYFIDNIILQLICFHSYDDLKIVVFTSENSSNNWDYIKKLPHCFSNDKKIRFFATNDEEQKTVSEFLEKELMNRAGLNEEVKSENVEVENETEENTFIPYYLILTDDYLSIRKLGITEKLMSSNANFGFSFLITENRLGKLPSECETFINVGLERSTILSTKLNNSYQRDFANEISDRFDMNECAEILANIPIEFKFDYRNLPNSLSFLDMYSVGKLEQLNTMMRWRLNDSTKTLRAPVGVDDLGNKIYLDLHEKAHGPHGLIAGTTGSGKSEFIITYILSMALNYSPNEVAFILIDYKGGGLAGAFENKKNNIRLPHLAGTITNLDKNELNRTLVSIDSELKRRQQKFNEARDELGESTMDIYKYQRFFRERKLSEPIPHLFIISDEFAELKAQQPEFMDNLISAARIGRSLGVHLILATQKPSGVVNDQIWSNSKFRVCLKVQDKSDSNEMLKCPDAASITNAGRFYLQVGYNEVFVLGQSGWAGASYVPKNLANKQTDHSLSFIDNVGDIIKTVEFSDNKTKVESKGDELSNVLKYITNIATRENVAANQLWLENIPEKIYLKDLISKYHFHPNGEIEAIIGEYDDPSNQYQGLLTLKLDSEGNTIVYGLSGVGREMFVKAIVYSCSTLYKTDDVNFYIFDFGSESLRIFEKLPHVGDIVFASETEKVDKLFQLIDKEISHRKELFADYNGDYATYCKSSGHQLPRIVTIINNYDSFKENYANYEETLLRFARDGNRYGVLMILTTSSQSGIYNRFLRNFSHVFVMDMNDKNDYMSILGRIGNTYPCDYVGRGLFKEEIAYEFQTASIIDDELLIDHIKQISDILAQSNSYIPVKVPVLPKMVTLDMIYKENVSMKNVPLGIERESLEIYSYNFKADKATIISSNEIENCIPIVKNILATFKKMGNVISVMMDMEDIFVNQKELLQGYYASNVTNMIEGIQSFVDEKLPHIPHEFVLLVCGLEKLKTVVDNTKFGKLIDNLKKLPNATIIYIDSSYKMKKVAFDTWYTNVVYNANGIWVGSGALDQTAIKLTDIDKRYKTKIGNEYAWVFKNGTGKLVKLIDEEVDSHEE